MTIFEIYQNAISLHNYKLEEMENKIEEMYALGRITAEERLTLLQMAEDNVNDLVNVDIVAMLADHEARILAIESKGIQVWKSGMVVAKGQTVLYDVLKEGQLRYCRYDGGRATTSSSPGNISGWVVLSEAGGSPVYRIEKDAEGQKILVPIEENNETN